MMASPSSTASAAIDWPIKGHADWQSARVPELARIGHVGITTPGRPGDWPAPTWGSTIQCVDGHFHHAETLPAGVTLTKGVDGTDAELGLTAGATKDPFAAAAQQAGNGFTLTIAEGTKTALHVAWLQSGQAGAMGHGHVAVRVGAGATVTLIEAFHGNHDANQASNNLTTLAVASGAIVHHVRLQDESRSAYHVHTVFATQERDSRLTTHSLDLGATWSRFTLRTRLAAEGAHTTIRGLQVAGRNQHHDAWTRVDHAAAHTTSLELVKGVLAANGHTGFTGNLVVRPGSSGVSSDQQNRNLLLSREARVDTTPQLEIHNDDVQCAHGSTVGQLDDDALFFLRARGIPIDAARVMLTRAFADEALAGLPNDIRDHVRERLMVWFARRDL